MGCDDGKPDNIMFVKEFQSTHPSWGATLICNHFFYKAIQISIHAPIVGCDDIYLMLAEMLKISIHAPIVGCDLTKKELTELNEEFQSTHPSWGATLYFIM